MTTMHPVTPDTTRTDPRRPRTCTRPARTIFALCAWLFAAGVTLQVFLAGLGALVNPTQWGEHRAFGSLILTLPYLMLVTGLIGRLPGRTLVLVALLIPLGWLQHALIAVPPDAGWAALRALHAVNGFVLFWAATNLAWSARELLRRSAA